MGPAFPESEHRERLDRARQALRRAGLDGCICIAPEHLYYIGGYDAHTHFSEQGLVFTTGDDQALPAAGVSQNPLSPGFLDHIGLDLMEQTMQLFRFSRF